MINNEFAGLSIAFDLDGTLVDTARDLLRVLDAVCAPDGVSPCDQAALRPYIGLGSRALITLSYKASDIALPEARLDAVQKRFLALYAENIAQKSVPYPGVIETLTRLKRGGASLSICTNKPGYLARPLMDALDMTRFFDRIIGSDDTAQKKPAAGHVFHAAGHRGCNGPIIMVGDSAPDVNAAKAAKAASIVMSYGYSPAPVETLGADIILRNFREIPSAIKTLAGKMPN
jgi:phosphoglycolate phosphatase